MSRLTLVPITLLALLSSACGGSPDSAPAQNPASSAAPASRDACSLITAEEASAIDGKAAIGLIFRPGFSTHDQETKDAGRGVGLDVVWKTVRGMGDPRR